MPDYVNTKGPHFVIEFAIGETTYGAVICHEYSLTEHENGTEESPNMVPVYECHHIDMAIMGTTTLEHANTCTIEAVNVHRVHQVGDVVQATKDILKRSSQYDSFID